MSLRLARAAEFGYTAEMHSIDRIWTELAPGYQAIQSFKTRLTGEFGRAVRVGRKLQYKKELTEWQKKRRILFGLAAVGLLSILTLCLTAFYFREVACVIVYWAVLVSIILVTLAVAGRQYIQQAVNDRPVRRSEQELDVDLEGDWWESLARQDGAAGKPDRKEDVDLLTQLAGGLKEPWLGQTLSDGNVVLLGPTGIWVFREETWSGKVVKQQGTWSEVTVSGKKPGRKPGRQLAHDPGPDEQWLLQKNGIEKQLEQELPGRAWTLKLIQGGVVFSHPKVHLDKKNIQDNCASYGLPKAWAERIRRAPAVEGFTLEMQLEILDALAEDGGGENRSAREEAERLYQAAAAECRANVVKMVN
jgi:hypothetical protein